MSRRLRRALIKAIIVLAAAAGVWALSRYGLLAWLLRKDHPARPILESSSWVAAILGLPIAVATFALQARSGRADASSADARSERATLVPADEEAGHAVPGEGEACELPAAPATVNGGVNAEGQGLAVGIAGAVTLNQTTVLTQSSNIDSNSTELLLVPIEDLDPFDLEVHPAIAAEPGDGELPVLPTYVPRPHDLELHKIVQRASAGDSSIAVLVGGSSTGKTRACFESVQHLPSGWTLWHPISPGPPQAVISGLAQVPPRTVIWLNELQQYLITPKNGVGEEVAARLRGLLRDRRHAPVLILGTIWPEYLHNISDPSSEETDRHAQARSLLSSAKLRVPPRFEPAELAVAHEASQHDPRLRRALAFAHTGEITQYLAGAPAMVERYQTAPASVRAVIDAAVDVRRMGSAVDLPRSFLERAAPGYMSESEWQVTNDDWLEQALNFASAVFPGATGMLVQRRTKPGEVSTGEPYYRLADYLAQRGRGQRCFEVPPPAFWEAARVHLTHADALMAIANAAAARWRTQYATLLYERAAELGDSTAFVRIGQLHQEGGNFELAEKFFRRAAIAGDQAGQVALARLCDHWGNPTETKRWLRSAADQGDHVALQMLAQLAETEGDNVSAERLLREAVTAAPFDRAGQLRQLARLRAEAGDAREAAELRARARKGVQTFVRRPLPDIQRRSGGAAALERSVRKSISDAQATGRPIGPDFELLAEICEDKGDQEEAERVAEQAARAGYPSAYRNLVVTRGNRGQLLEAERLARRAADAGDADSLLIVADAHHDDERWHRIRRFGLEPDGSTAAAWP